MKEMNCRHCGYDIVAHHSRNLRCPNGATIYQQADLPSGAEILKSFDARDWAKAFVAHVKQIPTIATDEETMVTWFANALMRGYDERHWQTPEYKRSVRRAMVPWWKRWFVPLDKAA